MSEADPATAAATGRATQYKEATDKLRERSDAAAKSLVGLGTAGLTAVGISKFSDVFPVPPGETASVVVVIVAFVVMAAVLVSVTLLLLEANGPVIAEVDADDMSDDVGERIAIRRIYDAVARQNGVPALRVYAARGERLQRIADRKATATDATPIQAKATRIRAETEAAMARAVLLVSRQRTTAALTDWRAGVCAVLFTIALLAFGIGADRLDSKRSGEITAYKACAEADAAHAMKLPRICDGVVPAPATADPAAQKRDALLELYTSCIGTATKQKSPLTICDQIKTQLDAAAK
jgi:hypothetical protein